MSLQSWKEAFAPDKAKDVPKDKVIEATRRLFVGCRQENLDLHKVKCANGEVWEFGTARPCTICSGTMPMCHTYGTYHGPKLNCHTCPIYKVRGKNCGQRLSDEIAAPYIAFRKTGNPEPMIAAISQARDWVNNNKPKGQQ